MGDVFNHIGENATIISRSNISQSNIGSAVNKVESASDKATADAFAAMVKYIEASENRVALENLEALIEEMLKTNSKPSVLKSLWEGIVKAIPTIAQFPAAITVAASIFNR